MKNWMAVLAFLLIFTLVCFAPGCDNTDHGTVPGTDPGTDPGTNPGTDPGTDPDPSAVAPVPKDEIHPVYMAVIHLGDLWVGTADQWWRQTDSGIITDFVWAPDGHGLLYFQSSNPYAPDQDLYYLALGQPPVLLDYNVYALQTWLNKEGWLWNPDSDSVAYAIDEGNELILYKLHDMSKTSLTLNKPCCLGPYWLSNGIMVFSTDAERPELVFINTLGQVQNTILDASLPYPLPNGLIIALGEYDPDGAKDSFYYTGLARTNNDGSGLTSVFDKSINFHLMAREPVTPHGVNVASYLAMSDPETLFLQKFAGVASEVSPNTVELLSQDLFITYSEFAYPFWFSWAPHGDDIAALPFTLSQAGDFEEQEGYWDLVVVDKMGTKKVVVEKIYTISGSQSPVPFQGLIPLNWCHESTHINYLKEREDGQGHDWWQVNAVTGATNLVLEKSGLPGYRPPLHQ